jgi:hypothetical protein
MGEPAQPVGWLTAEQADQMVANAVASALAQHQSSQQASGSITADQVQGIVNEALARQTEAHQQELQTLMASLRGSVVTYIPEHAGGPGTEIAATWSQYEQTKAQQAAEAAKAA